VNGHDFGTTIELVSGLSADYDVVMNPSDSLSDAIQVRVAKTIFGTNRETAVRSIAISATLRNT
jgi:hypothetical protein